MADRDSFREHVKPGTARVEWASRPRRDLLDEVLAGVLLILSGPCWVGAGYCAWAGLIFGTCAWLALALVFVAAAIFVWRGEAKLS